MKNLRAATALAASLLAATACTSNPSADGAVDHAGDTTATTDGAADLDRSSTDSADRTLDSTVSSSPGDSTPPDSAGDPSTGDTSTDDNSTSPIEPPTFAAFDGISTITDFADYLDEGLDRWTDSVPDIEDRRIESSADGASQPVLWLPPDGAHPRPLLVVLHSWSSTYVQHAGIPYAMWAAENGWAAIAPDFRGVNDDADALGSGLAVQDVVDAITFATAHPGVDGERVYAVGYSGGGMMALLLAGRHPDLVDAAAAWGPPADLISFYERTVGSGYAADIIAGCGGDPTSNPAAASACAARSPISHLDAARAEGVDVFLGQGIEDTLVSPAQGAETFNLLADPDDRLGPRQIATLAQNAVPGRVADESESETYFGANDPPPVFTAESSSVRLVFIDAGHDMVYGATARWLASFASDPTG